MKKIYLNGEVKKCTERELKVLEKFFVVKEEEKIITVNKVPKAEEIYKLSTRQVFKDTKSIKKFIKFLSDNNLEYMVGNTSSTARLIAVHSDHIHDDEDLMKACVPNILYTSRFTVLYPDSTRYDMVFIERFKNMTDDEIDERQWIFDMALVNRKRKASSFVKLFEDMVFVVNKQKLPFECKVKTILNVVKNTAKK